MKLVIFQQTWIIDTLLVREWCKTKYLYRGIELDTWDPEEPDLDPDPEAYLHQKQVWRDKDAGMFYNYK